MVVCYVILMNLLNSQCERVEENNYVFVVSVTWIEIAFQKYLEMLSKIQLKDIHIYSDFQWMCDIAIFSFG